MSEENSIESTREHEDTGKSIPTARYTSGDLAARISTMLASVSDDTGTAWPTTLGRYRIDQQIGRGGYGIVLRAWDPALQRDVAIKVARPDKVDRVAASSFLLEARTQARLSHNGIAQVYDCGDLPNGGFYIVSQFYPGGTLAKLRESGKNRSFQDIANLVADVADTLDYAHTEGIIHRDIKPANILIDKDGKPVLTDFGLALLDNQPDAKPGVVGTLAYMSPEQIRGESHRVTGSADIYSLGLILFELLAGRLPYAAPNIHELRELIRTKQLPRLRDTEPHAPEELNDICDRALQKRPTDRYQHAREMAEDLRAFTGGSISYRSRSQNAEAGSVDSSVTKIRPRGLRAFERNDAGFFLDLLPGLKDRDGLPESVRFWKQRIEPETAEPCFRVGMLWGPSGSGKSSLVRAGVIPNLSPAVIPTVTNARASNLEARILQDILSHVALDASDLTSALAAIRSGAGLPAGNKLLIVIDQFEQFLHRAEDLNRSELAESLRQCDGDRVQALLIVREDFVTPANQFMEMLEEPLSQDTNWAVLDLFSREHARKVLLAYGRALSTLPSGALGREQSKFIDSAIDGLVEDGKIIPVRLSLLAEMLKEQPWVPATLNRFGGMGGLAEAFLTERLEGAAAHPLAKAHPQATRELLRLLLPDEDSRIRRPAVAKTELIDRVAGFVTPSTAEKLLEAFDSDLKLVSTGTANMDRTAESATLHTGSDHLLSDDEQRRHVHYQLTHDYLVPSLNRWLHRNEMQSLKGRARFRLRELARLYRVTPEKRFVPGPFEYMWLSLLTPSVDRNTAESELMQRGRASFLRRFGLAAAMLTAVSVTAYSVERSRSRTQIIDRLSASRTTDVQGSIISAIGRSDVQTKLSANSSRVKNSLHLALALSDDAGIVQHLSSQYPEDIPVVAEIIKDRSSQLVKLLENDIANRIEVNSSGQLTFVAAQRQELLARLGLMANLDPTWEGWNEYSPVTLRAIVNSPALARPDWMRVFSSQSASLADAAIDVLESNIRFQNVPERQSLLSVAATFCAGKPEKMVELISWCDGRELQQEILSTALPERSAVVREAVRQYQLLDAERITLPGNPEEVAVNDWQALVADIEQLGGQLSNFGGYLPPITTEEFEKYAPRLVDAGLFPTSIVMSELDETELENPNGNAQKFQSTWADRNCVWKHDGNSDPAMIIHDMLESNQASWSAVDESSITNTIQHSDRLRIFGDRRPDLLMLTLRLRPGNSPQVDRDLILDRLNRFENRVAQSSRASAKADALLRVATELWRLGRYQECRNALSQIESSRDQQVLDSLWIKALVGMGEREQANDYVQKAIEREGNDQWLRASDKTRLTDEAELIAFGEQAISEMLVSIELGHASTMPDSVFDQIRAMGILVDRLPIEQNDIRQKAIEAAVAGVKALCESKDFSNFSQFWIEPDLDLLRTSKAFQKYARQMDFDIRVTGAWTSNTNVEDAYVLPCRKQTHDATVANLMSRGFRLMSTDQCNVFGDEMPFFASVLHRQYDREKRDQDARRRAVLAVLAANFEDYGPIVDALSTPGTLQAEAIEAAASSGVDPDYFLNKLNSTDDWQLQYALLLMLGSVDKQRHDDGRRQEILEAAARLAASPNASVSAAAKWCCRRLDRSDLVELAEKAPVQRANYRRTENGSVMVRISPPEQFVVGTPADEPGLTGGELRHWVEGIGPYEIAQYEITVEQFKDFLDSLKQTRPELDGQDFEFNSNRTPEPHSPQISVRLLDAMRYCQWLSEREGLPESEWCYPGIWEIRADEADRTNGIPASEYRLPPDFLKRTGYRLPLEEEWEYAARSGIDLARPFGQTTRLMSRYVHQASSMDELQVIPVGSLKPNNYGLFDTLGNVREWCQNKRTDWKSPFYGFARDASDLSEIGDRPWQYVEATDDRPVKELLKHYVRGGSFGDPAELIRCADRSLQSPEEKSHYNGFRIARTLERE